MSAVEHDEQQHTEPAERPVLIRTFVGEVAAVDGRTVDVRVVPFGEVARVADPPDYREYDEEWMPGCFDHQLRAANRVHAKVNHSPHVIDTVGHGLALRREADGYHASFEIHETQAGETALALLRGGALPAVSLEARPVKNVRTEGGIVQRIRANLQAVAFVREGAFAGAKVLAVREPPEQMLDEQLLPVPMPPGVVERLRRQGFTVPDRYMAHPDDPDTPAQAGTSDDGTRLTTGAITTERK